MTNSETFDAYSEMVGSRAEQDPNLESACYSIDQMRCSDLLSLLTLLSESRSHDVTTESVIRGNRFHAPSSISQRKFHQIEGEIMDALPETEFVELSPLQPFGINTVLAGTNEKNVVAALRRSEVNADAATALFRIAISKFDPQNGNSVRLATNARISRAQLFDGDTKFLPHFKIFAQVTVGKDDVPFGPSELKTLADHLSSEVRTLDRIGQLPEARISRINIAIGNVLFMQDLASQGRADLAEIRRNTVSPDFHALEGLDIPHEIPFTMPDLESFLRDLGFSKGVRVISNFQQVIESHHPELLPRLTIDLGRTAGIGYYKHLAYKISAENYDEEHLPLVDGGTTPWASDYLNNRNLYTVTSGIGTELVGQYFL